jgi:phage shock protein PspC (stress-responsive transcriptional regulator)
MDTRDRDPTGPLDNNQGQTTDDPTTPADAGGAGGGDQSAGETAGPPSQEAQPGPRRLFRSRRDRVLGGVCGGLGDYFNIDPIIFRIAAVALMLAGGAGLLVYLAMLVLVPEEPTGMPVRPPADRNRAVTLLAVLVALVVLAPLVLPPVLMAGAVLVPLAALLLAGLGIWWLVSGQGAGGTPGEVLQRSALGVGVLLVLGLIGIGAAWAAAAGGGVIAAGLVIAAGVVLVVGAFAHRLRWLILPALALAVPVAFVSAAGIELRGGYGEREYRPRSAAELRDGYRLGAGRLVVDLRTARLPGGDTPLKLNLGLGEAVLLVPRNVCVATRSDIGIGASRLFDRVDGGLDIDRVDAPPAPAGTPRVVVDARVGIGALQVGHEEMDRHRFGRGFRHHGEFGSDVNRGCAGVGATPRGASGEAI